MTDPEVFPSVLSHFVSLAFIHRGNIWYTCKYFRSLIQNESSENDWKYVKYCDCMNKQTHTVESQGPLGSLLLLGWHDTLFQPPTTKPHMETGMQFLHLSRIDSGTWCYFSSACALSCNLHCSEPNWAQLHRHSKPYSLSCLLPAGTNMWPETWGIKRVLFWSLFKIENSSVILSRLVLIWLTTVFMHRLKKNVVARAEYYVSVLRKVLCSRKC